MACPDSTAVAEDFIRLSLLFTNVVRRPTRLLANLKAKSRAFEVLFILQAHAGENVTMSRLAQEASMSKQQLTKLIHPLEADGLVRRERDAENRRRIYVAVTPAGACAVDDLLREAVQEIAPGMEQYSAEERRELAHCIAVFRRLLERLPGDSRRKEGRPL